MAATMWVAQHVFSSGIPASLAVGWVACLAVLIPVTIARWRKEPA
jgi:hypothetical protein